MGKRKINESDYEYILQLYRDGLDSTSIANMFDVTPTRIIQILHNNDINVKNRRYFNFSDVDKKKIVDMYKSGISVVKIAEKYGCSRTPITRVLHDFGIELDTPLRKVPKEDHKKIVDMYNSGMSQQEIANVYECSEHVIWIIMKNLNATLRPHGYTFEQAKNMYEFYKQTKSANEVAKIYNTDGNTIRSVLKKYGFEVDRIKYHCDDYYFDIIDTPDQAYILGLLWSDGCNNYNKGTIQLSLQERDKHILESINELTKNERRLSFFGLNDKNPNWQNTYTLVLQSRHMSQVLNDYGMVPRKSLVLELPDWLHEELYADFLRGYIDGDGSIYFNSNKNLCRVSLMGTKMFLDKVYEICHNLNVKTSFYHCDTNNDITYTLSTTNNSNTITFLQWLYKDSNLKLERKYNKYQQILEHYNINNSLTA